MISDKNKQSQLEKGILKITIDGKFKGLYSIWKNNGSGWLAKVKTTDGIKYANMDTVEAIYQKKYSGKDIGLKIY